LQSFPAYRIAENAAALTTLQLAQLSEGEVTIAVAWSGINYKDALAATGTARILRRYPLVGGIDLAGTVVQSQDPRFTPGEAVLVTGCGLSETHDGGYAHFARVPGDWVVPLPAGLTLRSAMALGTAGFTAALALERMELNGQTPAQGPVVVTGATGGVGSIAIDLLAGRGYEVIAVTGKSGSHDYLRALGASQVLSRDELTAEGRPLERVRWAGAIDNLGGPVLASLLRSTDSGGNVASVGQAAGAALHTTVMPFILRGVNLLGIGSVGVARAPRLALWQRLATDLASRHLERIVTRVLTLEQLPQAFATYLDASHTGRTLVHVNTEAL